MPDTLKITFAVVASGLPVLVCWGLWQKVRMSKTPEWQSMAAVSCLSVAAAVVLLLSADIIKVLSIEGVAVQTTKDAEQVERLTKQNKELAYKMVDAILVAREGVLLLEPDGEGHRSERLNKALQAVVTAAGGGDLKLKTEILATPPPSPSTNQTR